MMNDGPRKLVPGNLYKLNWQKWFSTKRGQPVLVMKNVVLMYLREYCSREFFLDGATGKIVNTDRRALKTQMYSDLFDEIDTTQ